MTQDPSLYGVYIGTFGNVSVPTEVPAGSWKYLCNRATAQLVLNKIVASMIIPTAVLYDAGPSEYPAMPLMYQSSPSVTSPDETIKFWGIKGADSMGNVFDESAGWLFDRLTNPITGDTIPANGMVTIKSVPFGATLPGWSELHWT